MKYKLRARALRLISALAVLLSGLTAGGAPAAYSAAAGWAEPGAGSSAAKAAFIRNKELWMKTGEKEVPLVQGEAAHAPKWSPDGQWIAYRSGDTSIRVIQPSTGKKITVGDGTNPQWAPQSNLLAFQNDAVLQVVDVAKAEEQGFENAAFGVGNYSWLPNGQGFLISTQAQPLPDGWSDIRLYEVPYVYGQEPQNGKLLVSIPSQSKSFFAVQTGTFRWSSDKKWVAFIAEPTASLSADGNTLCVFFWNSKKVIPTGEMLARDDWFHWSPRGDMLAFIAGSGRDATLNKKLTVKRPPFRKQVVHTPQGFADRDPVWDDNRSIIVSRVKEKAGGSSQSAGAAQPFLAKVAVAYGSSAAITAPEGEFGDYSPAVLPASQQLTWIRSNGKTAAVWIGGTDGSGAKEWIGGFDLAPSYYGQWVWSEVVDRYVSPPG